MKGRYALLVVLLLVVLCNAVSQVKAGMYSKRGRVANLDADSFENDLKTSSDVWVVKFYTQWCGHCKALAPHMKKAAKEAKSDGGRIHIAAIDCDVSKDLCSKFRVKGFPTIKLFGADKDEPPKDFKGQRTADGILSEARSLVESSGGGGSGSGGNKKTLVERLKTLAPTLDYLDIHTFLHINQKPKVLLLGDSAKQSAPGWLSTAAMKFKSGRKKDAIFAYVPMPKKKTESNDAIINEKSYKNKHLTAKRFGVEEDELPQLFVLATNKNQNGTYVRYPGDLTLSSTVKLRENVIDFVKGFMKTSEDSDPNRMAIPSFPEPKRPRKKVPASLHVLTSDSLDQRCFQLSGKSCVIFFVEPDSGSSDDVQSDGSFAFAAKDTLIAVSKKYRHDPLAMVYVDAVAQNDFAAAFGVESSALPAVAVVKTGRRTRYAKDTETNLSRKEIVTFLDKVLSGDKRFTRLQELPELAEGWEMRSEL